MLNYFPVHSNIYVDNKIIKEIIVLIGKRFDKNEQKPFNKGRDEVKRILATKDKSISNRELKRFINPSKRNILGLDSNNINTRINFLPVKSFHIFETILEIIQNDRNLLVECRNLTNYTTKCICRDALIKDFFQVILEKKDVLQKWHIDLYNNFYWSANKTCNKIIL
ncbi:MAG: hypothetical protein GQ564_19715 [Bacteroidales bacterium]|nr:hypothetical protein [Bacteroidales bacterium]